MISRSRKLCLAPNCKNCRVAGGFCGLRAHQLLRSDSQWIRAEARREAKKKEPRKSIPKESKAQAKRNKQYAAELPEWKEQNSFCVYPGCGSPHVQCHHVIGRGKHTNNKKYMIALCEPHHDICKSNPKLAFELGLIKTKTISRKHEY